MVNIYEYFENRRDAGERLSAHPDFQNIDKGIVLALTREGVPIGAEIARAHHFDFEPYYRQRATVKSLRERSAILTTDGIEDAALTIGTIHWLRNEAVNKILVATPVIAPAALSTIERVVDKVIFMFAPHEFYAAGEWYMDFSPTSDLEIDSLLEPFKYPVEAT